MATTKSEIFWGFLFWIRHNPYKSFESMTEDELLEHAKQYAAVNATEASLSTDPLNYGDAEFPKRGTTTRYATDTNGIETGTDLATNIAAAEQSLYPEEHLG